MSDDDLVHFRHEHRDRRLEHLQPRAGHAAWHQPLNHATGRRRLRGRVPVGHRRAVGGRGRRHRAGYAPPTANSPQGFYEITFQGIDGGLWGHGSLITGPIIDPRGPDGIQTALGAGPAGVGIYLPSFLDATVTPGFEMFYEDPTGELRYVIGSAFSSADVDPASPEGTIAPGTGPAVASYAPGLPFPRPEAVPTASKGTGPGTAGTSVDRCTMENPLGTPTMRCPQQRACSRAAAQVVSTRWVFRRCCWRSRTPPECSRAGSTRPPRRR